MTIPSVPIADQAVTASGRQSRGLLKRVIVSIIVIAMLLVVFAADHAIGVAAPILLAVGLALGFGSTREMIHLFRVSGITIRPTLIQSLVAVLIASNWFLPVASSAGLATFTPTANIAQLLVTFSVGVMAIFFASTHRYRAPGQNLTVVAAELLCLVYVGLLLSILAQFRWVISPNAGYLILTSVIIATKGGDIGAYAFGRMFGKTKMTPRLSPAKTWWGFRGALIGSTLLSVLWLSLAPRMFDPTWTRCPILWSAVYGLILGVVGIVGDLFESLIKRDLGQKDSSKLMPGFGGILDILDSIMYASPVALIFWLYFPPVQNWV